MHDHETDLLIGAQIIAKGHHFPNLTLVGVVEGDLVLSGGDLRAAERCVRLLYQVAGRSAREQRPGGVLIHTHLPEHPVMQAVAAGDKERFYSEEIAERGTAACRRSAAIASGSWRSQLRRSILPQHLVPG
jgi:primosomal protein N' (replication factor Y)